MEEHTERYDPRFVPLQEKKVASVWVLPYLDLKMWELGRNNPDGTMKVYGLVVEAWEVGTSCATADPLCPGILPAFPG